MTRAVPRRRAEPAPRRRAVPRPTSRSTRRAIPEPVEPRTSVALEGPTAPSAIEPAQSVEAPPKEIAAWFSVVVLGFALLGLGVVPIGPDWVPRVGSVLVGSAYTWLLAARTGGRPVVFGGLALVLGGLAVAMDQSVLLTGAAVTTAAIAATLGVMITVPALTFVRAVRETCLAVLVAAGGAVAALGFGPTMTLDRFRYAALTLALVCAFVVVYRLGAGLHGLGRRGLFVVLTGGVVLVLTLLYADLLRRYGGGHPVFTFVDWCRHHIGGFPRPLVAILGVPALAWGTHMRARRRQGWWVTAFGVAATTTVATSLMNPDLSVTESALSVVYGLLLGLLIGYVVIRVDLALTGDPAGRRTARSRRSGDPAAGVRPEPKRTAPLL